jgi:hypothetical protein
MAFASHMTECWKIFTQLGESVLCQFMEDGVVCPAILQKGLGCYLLHFIHGMLYCGY